MRATVREAIDRSDLEGGNEKWRSRDRMPWPSEYGRVNRPASMSPLGDVTRAAPIVRGVPHGQE